MSFVTRDVAHGSDEDKADRLNIVRRLEKISQLLRDEPPGEARMWLMQEEMFYQNGGRHMDWPAYKFRLKEIGAEQRKIYAKKEQERQAQEAAAKAADDAIKAKIQAQIDADNDPVTKYRREHSTPTF